MDTGQKTESIAQLVDDNVKDRVALPEFQRYFVWDIEKTFDLFDSFVRDPLRLISFRPPVRRVAPARAAYEPKLLG